jgi:hypothetical protein
MAILREARCVAYCCGHTFQLSVMQRGSGAIGKAELDIRRRPTMDGLISDAVASVRALGEDSGINKKLQGSVDGGL